MPKVSHSHHIAPYTRSPCFSRFKDVLTTVNSEWDTQLNEHAGRIDMWYWKDIKDSPEGTSGNTTLATLLAKREKDTKTNMPKRNKTERYLRSYDVLPGTQRALLIRGRRAGDGEPFEEVFGRGLAV